MIPESFESLYRRLAGAAERYHSVEHCRDEVTILADAHRELHRARRAIAEERSRLETVGAIYTPGDRRWLDGVGIDACRMESRRVALAPVTNGSGIDLAPPIPWPRAPGST